MNNGGVLKPGDLSPIHGHFKRENYVLLDFGTLCLDKVAETLAKL